MGQLNFGSQVNHMVYTGSIIKLFKLLLLLQLCNAQHDRKGQNVREAIMNAIDEDDIDQLKDVIGPGYDIESTRLGDKSTVIHYAIKRNHPSYEIILILLSKGTSAFKLFHDIHGFTELMTAIRLPRPDISIITALAEFSAERQMLEGKDKRGFTALHIATDLRAAETIMVIAKAGGQMEAVNVEGNTPLMLAVLLDQWNKDRALGQDPGYTATVGLLLQLGANPNTVNSEGQFPLEVAIRYRRKAITKLLLEHGADPNMKTKDGDSVLHIIGQMIYDNWYATGADLAAMLLDKGADLDIRNRIGETPLHLFAKANDYEGIPFLIKAGVNVSATTAQGRTALMYSGMNERNIMCPGCIAPLAAASKDIINLQDDDGLTALHYAVANRYSSEILFLLRGGANVSVRATESLDTPLMHMLKAYKYDSRHKPWSPETVKWLISRGGGVNALDTSGNSPILIAAKKFYGPAVDLLIEARANTSIRNKAGLTPLLAACRAPEKEGPRREPIRINMFAKLVKGGSDVNERDDRNWTCLHHIVSLYSRMFVTSDTLQSFLDYHPDLDAVNDNGDTVLGLALKSSLLHCKPVCFVDNSLHTFMDYATMIEMLLNMGSNPNIPCADGNFPLHLAVMCTVDDITVVTALVNNGASVDAIDPDGNSALHMGCRLGHVKIVQLLLSREANVDATNRYGRTPLMLSTQHKTNSLKIAKLLIERNASLDKPDDSQRSVLVYAAEQGLWKLIMLLLSSGADPNVSNPPNESPLTSVIRAPIEEVDTARALIKHGADVNHRTGRSETPVFVAASRHYAKILELLFEAGASTGSWGRHGQTEIMVSIDNAVESVVTVGVLLSNANHTKAQLSKALVVAACNRHSNIARLLLEHGAEPNFLWIQGGGSYTTNLTKPLAYAVKNGDSKMIVTLLEHGAETKVKYRATADEVFVYITSICCINQDWARCDNSTKSTSYSDIWLKPARASSDGITYMGCFKTEYPSDIRFIEGKPVGTETGILSDDPISTGDSTSNPIDACMANCTQLGFLYAGIKCQAKYSNVEAQTCKLTQCYCFDNEAKIRSTSFSDECTLSHLSTNLSAGGMKSIDVYFIGGNRGVDLACPSGWSIFKGYCYKLLDSRKTFQDAHLHCLSYGANIVSIWEKSENSFIESLAYGSEASAKLPVWLGLHRVLRKNALVWSDGTGISYQNFPNYEIMDSNFTGCVVITPNRTKYQRGLWSFEVCSRLHFPICKLMAFRGSPEFERSNNAYCIGKSFSVNYIILVLLSGIALIVIVCACIPLCPAHYFGRYVISIRKSASKTAASGVLKKTPSEYPAHARQQWNKVIEATGAYKADLLTFCEETTIQGFKELLTAQTLPTKILWFTCLLILVCFMITQSVTIWRQYNYEETATSIKTELMINSHEVFNTITICGQLFGGWGRADFPGGDCSNLYQHRPLSSYKELLMGYGSTENLILGKEFLEDIEAFRACQSLPTVSHVLGLIWGIRALGGVSYASEPFITSKIGEGGPLICRLAESRSCDLLNGCEFAFAIDIDYATFIRTKDYLNVPKEFVLYYSHYYTYDIPVAKILFQDRRELHKLRPVSVQLRDSELSQLDIHYSRRNDDMVKTKPFRYTVSVGIEATKYILDEEKKDNCQLHTSSAILPGWLRTKSCRCNYGDGAACWCEELEGRRFGNCSHMAVYDKNVAAELKPCNIMINQIPWLGKVPVCWRESCERQCRSLPYCTSWSVKRDLRSTRRGSKWNHEKGVLQLNIALPTDILIITERILMTWEEFLGNVGGLWGLYIGCSFVSVVHVVWFIIDTIVARKHRRSLYHIIVQNYLTARLDVFYRSISQGQRAGSTSSQRPAGPRRSLSVDYLNGPIWSTDKGYSHRSSGIRRTASCNNRLKLTDSPNSNIKNNQLLSPLLSATEKPMNKTLIDVSASYSAPEHKYADAERIRGRGQCRDVSSVRIPSRGVPARKISI